MVDDDVLSSPVSIEEERHFQNGESRTANTTNCSNYNNQKDVNCRFNKHNLGYQHRRRGLQQHQSHETHHTHHNHHYNHQRRKWWNGIIFYMCHVLFITSTIALSDSSDGNSDGSSSSTNSQEEHIQYSTNVIETRFGAVRGIIVGTNPPVDAYLGIPYASPPVGSLR